MGAEQGKRPPRLRNPWIRTWAGILIPKRLTKDELTDKDDRPLFPVPKPKKSG